MVFLFVLFLFACFLVFFVATCLFLFACLFARSSLSFFVLFLHLFMPSFACLLRRLCVLLVHSGLAILT